MTNNPTTDSNPTWAMLLALPARAVAGLVTGLARVVPAAWRPKLLAFAKKIVGDLTSQAVISLILFGLPVIGLGVIQPWRGPIPKPCTGDRVCLAIVGLDDDKDERQTKHVVRALRTSFGQSGKNVQILFVPRQIAFGAGDDFEARRKAALKADYWLKRMKADLVIYGSVAEDGKVLDLGLLAPGQADGGLTSYALAGQTLTLPADFNQNVASAIAYRVAYAVQPGQGKFTADDLESLAVKLEALTRTLPKDLPWETRGEIHFSHGLALAEIGLQRSATAPLKSSLPAYEAALQDFTRERAPLRWADTQNNLGVANFKLGYLTDDKAYYEEAIRRYQASLQVLTADAYRLDWISGTRNLAVAVESLANLTHDEAMLNEAIKLFRTALGRLSPQDGKEMRVAVEGSLATSLSTLAEWRGDIEMMKEAIRLRRAAFAAIDEKEAPATWAGAKVNLGLDLTTLADMSDDPAHAHEALPLLKAGQAFYTQARNPDNWALCELITAEAWLQIGTHRANPAALRTALRKYAATDAVWSETSNPTGWAGAREGSAKAHFQLWRMTGDPAELRQARSEADKAIGVYRRLGLTTEEADLLAAIKV